MRTSYASFWRKSLGCARLAVISQLEYRFNLFIDTIVQPFLTGLIEVTLWSAIFAGSGQTLIAGFPRESYLAYALWASFVARAQSTWMYEFRMIDEIDTGSVNSILARPISFYEYYLSQFLGYKLLTTSISLVVPFFATFFFIGTDHTRIPAACLLIVYYLFLVHTLSFTIASFGFFFNRVHAFTVAKNIALWMLTGELFPLDLAPEPFKSILISLPFASGVYVPVAYITGRLGHEDLLNGFVSVTFGLMVMGPIAAFVWNRGRRKYSGTGA